MSARSAVSIGGCFIDDNHSNIFSSLQRRKEASAFPAILWRSNAQAIEINDIEVMRLGERGEPLLSGAMKDRKSPMSE